MHHAVTTTSSVHIYVHIQHIIRIHICPPHKAFVKTTCMQIIRTEQLHTTEITSNTTDNVTDMLALSHQKHARVVVVTTYTHIFAQCCTYKYAQQQRQTTS
eukprot:GHVS01019868.1.p1 GENE.GHVS01019868.1~~GHVS01019868.1.p1  ORF type:complete len:101 (+),score=10.54 GHVS01019868.1:610-912(+)